jgi:diguanylate cyclase (GGDEF)-like protein/putative nucleotidyltransferase with HDIG domain
MNQQTLPTWGRIYVGAIVLLGTIAIAQSIYALYAVPIGWNWFVLAILTLISGSATVKLPSVPATISISETFVFTSVLLFGPAAGTLTVALDALVISLWLARRGHPFYRIAFNVGAVPTALWVAAHIFYLISGIQPLSTVSTPVDIAALLKPLTLFTIVYFLLNSWLIAFAISIEKRLSSITVWKDNFAWLSLNYFGGASVAALLVTYTRNIDFAYLAFVLPLVAILYVTFAMSMGRVEDANKHLSQLNTIYMSTIETLAMAIDAKDQITHGHIRRVQHYAVGLARVIGVTDPAQISAIEAASLLHDMGKLAVPEYILNKPGPLTPSEFERMKKHASVGADILSAIDFPYPVVPIVRHHHESWDGSGYPDGVKGTDIPIGARILSVVDCFDALTSDRPYRPRLSDSEALKILVERRGSMYDPLIVDTFVSVHAQIAPVQITNAEDIDGSLVAITRSLSNPETVSTGSGLDNIAASTEETIVLYDLARNLAGRLDVGDITDTIAQHLRRIVPAATCVLYLFHDDSDDLVAAHAAGENAAHFVGLRIPRGQRLTGWVAANKQTIVNSDPVLDLGEVARSMRPRLHSCLSTSLVADSSLVGVLTLYATHRNAFTEDHRRIIEVVARQVAQVLKHSAAVDGNQGINPSGLGSLPGLAHLEHLISDEMSAISGPTALSIIFVNVDSFTALNRKLGRAAADQALAKVTESIKTVLRGSDSLFRHGQAEFVAVLKNTNAEAAGIVARRIAGQLSEQTVTPSAPEEGRILAQFGVATAPIDGVTAESLVAAARGRNQFPPRSSESGRPSVH